MEPKVSVVVPIYNAEKYLDRCVASIAGQSYQNLEIILVDDGSTDHCPAMCDEWAGKDSRIRVIHKKNAGAGMARNTGIDHATGEYLCYVDSDDYIDLQTIGKCVRSIMLHPVDVLIFGYCDAEPGGKIKAVPICGEKTHFAGEEIRRQLLPALFAHNLGVGTSACERVFDLKVIRQHNIRFQSEREIGSEDALFTLELFCQISTVGILPENLYYYYRNGQSFSRTYKGDRQQKNDTFLLECSRYAAQAGLPEAFLWHLQVRYHAYTFAAIKQIAASDLNKREKEAKIHEIYTDPILRETISKDVLRIEKPALRIFWMLVDKNRYRLCDFLVWYKLKMKRSRSK